ncbi:MAG: branched-chain amino acid ABC transporter permease [Actinomycetota bacterium]
MEVLRRFDRDLLVLAAGVLVLIPVPLFLSGFLLEVAIQTLLFGLLGVAWNLMGGFAGQFSFGHAAFFGIGAYATAVVVTDYGLSPWIGMLLGAALAAAFGVLVGFLSFRYGLKGVFFALATFAFAEMLRLIFRSLEAVNAARGFNIPIQSGNPWLTLQFPQGSPNYYYVILALLALTLLVVILLMRSRAGTFILSIRENEDAAAALGVNPMRYKLLAVAVSAALTAIGGAFYVQYFFFIDPDLAFGAGVSIQILLPAIVGGIGTIWGPVVGALIIIVLGQGSTALVRTPPPFLDVLQGVSGLDVAIYGALIVLVVLFLPRGVFGTLRERLRAA